MPPPPLAPATAADDNTPAPVSLTLTKKELQSAVNEKKWRKKKSDAGLTLWSAQLEQEKKTRLATLKALSDLTAKQVREQHELEAAIVTQADTRAVNAAGQEVRRISVDPSPADLAHHPNRRLAVLYAAAAVSAAVLPARLRLYLHPTRLDACATGKRVRQRVLSSTVDQLVNFACAQTQGKKDQPTRLPVFFVGHWASERGASSKLFAMQRFLRLLARKAVVIIAKEEYTTKVFYFNFFF